MSRERSLADNTLAVDDDVKGVLLYEGAQLQVHYHRKLSYNDVLRILLGLEKDPRVKKQEKGGGA